MQKKLNTSKWEGKRDVQTRKRQLYSFGEIKVGGKIRVRYVGRWWSVCSNNIDIAMLGYIYIGWRGSAGGREKADRQHKSL